MKYTKYRLFSISNLFNNLKHLIFVSIASVIAFSNTAVAQEINYPPGFQNCSVELNGDSVLFGYNGAIPPYSSTPRLTTTPAQWLRNKGYTVVDKTAGGLRTHDLLYGYLIPWPEAWPAVYPNGAQVSFWNTPHDSKIVVLQTGINDFKEPFNPQQTYNDYVYMVNYIRGLGKIPVITGVTQVSPAVGFDTYNKIQQIRDKINQVRTNYFVHYASFGNVPVMWTDGFHLTQDSSNGVTENLRYVLSVICGVPF